MKLRNYIVLPVCLVALTMAQAQDVVIRRNTTTTTTSTTTVSTRPSGQDRVVTRTGTLTISSTPTGAVVKIDGEYMGTTPLTIKKREPRTYHVTFSAEGYETQTKNVTVTAGKTTTCSATLSANQVQQIVATDTTSTLTISSTPSDAVVKIDGKYMGETPLILEKQKPGTYSIAISAEGYETMTESVTVTPGKTATCSAILRANQLQQIAQQPVIQQPVAATTTTASSTASQTFTVNGVSFNMILVEGGTFTMGATSEQWSDADSDEKPAHQVTLSSYYIGETEVTQALWEAVMGSNPSKFKGYDRPVECVSWKKCQAFISKLNAATGKKFRLPTEAEWEFAARGGNNSLGYKYCGSNNLDSVAWYHDNSGKKTHPVKTKSPNELGIYDMSGNVWEWCHDRKGKYNSSAQTNPTGPSKGSRRVDRGGGWYNFAWYCRVSSRDDDAPGYRYDGLGLRLVL